MTKRCALGAAAVLAAIGSLSGCGNSAKHTALPATVDLALAPKTLQAGALKLYPDTSIQVLTAFASAGKTSLISDGHMWIVRAADRLVATLEICTVKPDVNLQATNVRNEIIGPILAGAGYDIRLAGVEVYKTNLSDGKAVFVWFGQGLLEVFQVKYPQANSEALVQQIIMHQETLSAWVPLPPQVVTAGQP